MSLMIVGIMMGIGGTLVRDSWVRVLGRVFGQPMPNWAMPGRWLGHVPKGVLCHNDIGDAAAIPAERALGWLLHYGVGVVYGIAFLAIAGEAWLESPALFPIWVFSILTITAGWFLLQPGMGLGWGASKTPNPWKVRGLGLVAHTWFAIGMWLVALVA